MSNSNLSQSIIDCRGGTMEKSFSVKTSFSKQQLEYGTRQGYGQLILALDKDNPTKGEYITNLNLKDAIAFLRKKVNMIKLFVFHFKIKSRHQKQFEIGNFLLNPI